MNRNGKAIEKFLALREVERDKVANRAGKRKEYCQFRSYPMDKRVK